MLLHPNQCFYPKKGNGLAHSNVLISFPRDTSLEIAQSGHQDMLKGNGSTCSLTFFLEEEQNFSQLFTSRKQPTS